MFGTARRFVVRPHGMVRTRLGWLARVRLDLFRVLWLTPIPWYDPEMLGSLNLRGTALSVRRDHVLWC